MLHVVSSRLDVSSQMSFAAGDFIDIGASDLIPEVKAHPDLNVIIIHFAASIAGVALMLAVKLAP